MPTDTFFVRVFVSPVMATLVAKYFGSLAWWPGKMPEVILSPEVLLKKKTNHASVTLNCELRKRKNVSAQDTGTRSMLQSAGRRGGRGMWK